MLPIIIVSFVLYLAYRFSKPDPDKDPKTYLTKYIFFLFAVLVSYGAILYELLADVSLPVFALLLCLGIVGIPILVYVCRKYI